MRQITSDVLAKLKRLEAFIPYVYDDADSKATKTRLKPGMHIAGTATQGYGATGADVKPGNPDWTEEYAAARLLSDLKPYEAAVENSVKVPLSDNQFGALVLFTYNAGIAGFKGSTLLKKLNAGDYNSVPSELAKWNKTTINGKKVTSSGLVNRRASEAGLWAAGSYVQSSGTPALPQRAPLISGNALAAVTAVSSGGALQYIPHDGPIAYALAAVIVVALGFLIWKYVIKRTEN